MWKKTNKSAKGKYVVDREIWEGGGGGGGGVALAFNAVLWV